MQLPVYKLDGTQASKMKVSDTVFGIEPNPHIVHQAVLAELANSRQGTHSTKNRSAVRGGGRKPWRQKGRGVARAGTNRSPLWRGGGTVFGPTPHSYNYRLPKKMKRLARKSVLSDKMRANKIIVVETLQVKEPKTKAFLAILKTLDIARQKVIVLPAVLEKDLVLAARNLPNVALGVATSASTYDLLDCDVILTDKAGITLLNEQLSD
jgi:large subunit ribosomal protein L4